ncbi:MAG: DEAD/DEAH box helicase, partial [Rhodocyclaceae bacterium]|nr:DEAD/DEAH box helicase [Rhodocyclaceae bacterium]
AVPADRAMGAAPAEPASAPSQVGPAATPVETRRAASEPTGQNDSRSVVEPVASAEAPPEAPSTPTEAPAAASERPAAPPAVAPAPLPLAESFAALGLHPSVGDAIAAMGFDTPTPIQVEAIPVAMTGRDVIGLAQTGTGKTLAFVAPALHRILTTRREGEHLPGLLVLAPTRELTVQVAEEAERLSARSGLRVATIYGGVGMGPQIDALKGGVDVIVATPGRMLDHLRRGNVKIGSVQTLVLDEADRMLDMGFLPDVRTILRFLGEDRQTLFFTATMPPEIESLSLEFQREPVVVEIARRKPPESIDQLLYPVGKHLKAPLLVHLLKSDPDMKSVLVFTERKIDADVLAKRLREEGLKVALMHGDRRQQDREQALEDLASGKVQVLVATNVAARGLDIDDISHVVNYDIPQTVDEYVHRIGRTARAEAEGSAWTLVTVSDEVMVARIESALGRKLPRVQDPTFDYDVPTPSWAKPSAKDVLAMLNKSQSVADRMRHLGRRR